MYIGQLGNDTAIAKMETYPESSAAGGVAQLLQAAACVQKFINMFLSPMCQKSKSVLICGSGIVKKSNYIPLNPTIYQASKTVISTSVEQLALARSRVR